MGKAPTYAFNRTSIPLAWALGRLPVMLRQVIQ